MGGRGGVCVYATRRWAPKGKRARGWYKLYRSIDLLSEETLRCHYYCWRKLMLPLLLLLLLLRHCSRCCCRCCSAACWGAFSRTDGRSSSTHTSAQVRRYARVHKVDMRPRGKGFVTDTRLLLVTKGGGATLRRVAFSLPPFLPLPLSRWVERGLRWTWTVSSRASSRELATMIGRARHRGNPSM